MPTLQEITQYIWDNSIIKGLQVLIIIGFGAYVGFTQKSIDSRQKAQGEQLSREILSLSTSRLSDEQQKLREEYLAVPFDRRYLFLDSPQVDDQYSKFGEQAIMTAVDVELSTGLKKTENISLKDFMKTEAGEETKKKIKETFEVSRKVASTRYEELEAYAIRNKLTTYGVEKLEVAAPQIESFDQAVRRLEQDFGLKQDGNKVSQRRRELAEAVARQFVETLSGGPKDVLIRGNFLVSIPKDGGAVTFTFDHPLNQRFSLRKKLMFSFQLSPDQIAAAQRSLVQQSSTLPLGIYGKLIPVVTDAEYRLRIIPMAVYLR
jgi:hypothetical protein